MFRYIKLIVGVVAVLGLIYTGFWANNLWNGYPSVSPTTYSFTVEKGNSLRSIAENLEKDGVVMSSQVFLIQSRFRTMETLQTGEYQLELPANGDAILKQINEISVKKADEIAKVGNRPTATITIKEGANIDEIAQNLGKNGVVNTDDFLEYVQNPTDIEGQKYPFLPEKLNCEYGQLKTCAKYYLEGYLYPDTYSFFKQSTPKQVVEKMLGNFNTKVWSNITTKPSPQTFYKTLTMASVIEKETGRTKGGVTTRNIDSVNKERAEVAGVFINRMSQNTSWQSDVTASYGHGFKICQQTITVEACKFLDDPDTNTKYNTYIIKGYPIGPVSNPDVNNIKAALSPVDTDALFFVMDGTGKTYFASTESEHFANIEKVKEINADLGL